MVSVVILGAGGRMGAALVGLIPSFKNLTLAAAVEQPGHPSVGIDSGMASGHQPNGVKVSDDLEAAIAEGATIVRIGSAIFGQRTPANNPVSTEL